MKGKLNIALLSPSQKVYSETFIQAHKQRLNGNIFYYFSGDLPSELEGGLVINSRKKRLVDLIKGHLCLNKFSLAEQALITSFKTNKIDIIFAEYGGTGQRILPICKELNLPLIVHFHGYDASRKDQLEQNRNYKEVFEYANYLVVVSKKMYKDMLDLGCPSSKLVYNVCGPREEFLEVIPLFNKKQFISIGRFVDKKAPYYLILSFLEVVKNYPDCTLVMAGEGELWDSCKNLAKFYGLQAKILFPGIISAEEFRDYLEGSIAFLQHSITAGDGDAEGTPVSILEASAAGLPVLSTFHAGISDVIEDGVTGLLVNEHDVHGMAENMKKLLENPEKAKTLGINGKKNISENFSLDRHIQILDGLISKTLQGWNH